MEPVAVTIVTAFATPVALVVVAVINFTSLRRAAKDAKAAQDAARLASEQAEHAMSAQDLASKETKASLEDISKITHITHTIVNSQHTKLLQLVANLTARVASDNPHDAKAQSDAIDAAKGVDGHLKEVQVDDIDETKENIKVKP